MFLIWRAVALPKLPRSKCLRLGALIALCCLSVTGCGAGSGDRAVEVLVDGRAWKQGPVAPEAGDDLRVYITLDGKPLLDAPFGEAHSVRIVQDGVGENTVEITGEAVYMAHADCENQDCVHMGAVTRENLEMRVMGGFIICLPHKISVEVRGE